MILGDKSLIFRVLCHKETTCWHKFRMETAPEEWIKINTDAAYCYTTQQASVGVIARDHEGKVVRSS
jgi:hypothetical protein